jgi:hypothetical protein
MLRDLGPLFAAQARERRERYTIATLTDVTMNAL